MKPKRPSAALVKGLEQLISVYAVVGLGVGLIAFLETDAGKSLLDDLLADLILDRLEQLQRRWDELR